MSNETTVPMISPDAVKRAVARASAQIPPLWPLETSVAVNPFLGQADEPLAMVAARLGRLVGVSCTMPMRWYRAKLDAGRYAPEDIDAVLAARGGRFTREEVLAVLHDDVPEMKIESIAALCAVTSGLAWPQILEERFGSWAAAYLDMGQALWAAPRERGAFDAWRAQALHDLTPEILGLKGFARFVAELPDNADAVLAYAASLPFMQAPALEGYFHQLLLSLGGWAQSARYRQWQAQLAGRDDVTLREFLAIRLVFDLALMRQYGAGIADSWRRSITRFAQPVVPSRDTEIACVLQEALERGSQRALAVTLAAPLPQTEARRPALQAIFCIDVRSEVFRRALESLSPDIETRGFAGFFGLGVAHRGMASDVTELRLPVLLSPALESHASAEAQMDSRQRIRARATRAWSRFRHAAVSSFSFVEAAGPLYAGKLLASALGQKHDVPHAGPAPVLDRSVDASTRVSAAEAILKAMSLTTSFAPVVLLVGHGATTTNNPHASALHCGACGGHAGDVNARLLVGLLNDLQVREGLAARGLAIPHDTVFVGGLHDTTTDRVTLYPGDLPAGRGPENLGRINGWLTHAGVLARSERALRLPGAQTERAVETRSRMWAEVRPEWGLAGCSAFIAAPRRQTRGRNLGGRAFLHDYEWAIDQDFRVLELILTAPVVVASWISLQYYGSAVVPDVFGAGNKLLHNVTGGIGVVEGSGGLLRGGLPWQSVHDGQDLVHEPLRLTVCVAAPCAAISDVLSRHPQVRALFDNGWLSLLALDDAGQVTSRYAGGLRWTAFREAYDAPPAALSRAAVPA